MNRLLLTILLTISTCWTVPAHAASPYEDSLRLLAEGVIADVATAKRSRLAVMDFTDAKGIVTPVGQFIAEELGTQIMVTGEFKVVDRALVSSTLKKFHVTKLEPAQAKAVTRAAKAVRADVFLAGSYLESAGEVRVTVKLLNPSTVQSLGATRGTLPKAGPLGDLIKDVNKPPVVIIDPSAKTPPPSGLGFHRNEQYQLVVTALHQRDNQITADLTIENTSSRDIKVLCLLQNTLLEDNHGALWKLEAQDNREGLCARGLELSPREKDRAVLTFSAPAGAQASHFTLRYHERTPRTDARFTIEGLTAEPAGASPAVTDTTAPPSTN
ncbi:MAG: FlgO family outer membrane protein [Nitrospirota bacterium]|nr:FlgO family outer membrane protein [Nitrospirota bacterium]MDP3598694.1 FlgO family outer membrane protein [Nitrospirota bacterium]